MQSTVVGAVVLRHPMKWHTIGGFHQNRLKLFLSNLRLFGCPPNERERDSTIFLVKCLYQQLQSLLIIIQREEVTEPHALQKSFIPLFEEKKLY